jgi:hypothetical protein
MSLFKKTTRQVKTCFKDCARPVFDMGVWSGTQAGMVHMVIVISMVSMVIVAIMVITMVIGHMDNLKLKKNTMENFMCIGHRLAIKFAPEISSGWVGGNESWFKGLLSAVQKYRSGEYCARYFSEFEILKM